MSQNSAAPLVGAEAQQAKGASSKGGSQAEQHPAGSLSEAELRRRDCITPGDVLRLEKATEGESRPCRHPRSLEGGGVVSVLLLLQTISARPLPTFTKLTL